MKRLIIGLFVAATSWINITAQKYIVFSMLGKVNTTGKKGIRPLQLRDSVTPNTIVIIPYNGELVLFDQPNKKKYIISTPGKATIRQFMNDEKNRTVSLSAPILKAMIARIASKNETIIQTIEDHITITRDDLTDSTSTKKTQKE